MDTEQPIPIETEWVARRIRIDINVVNTVLKDFFIKGKKGWSHDICDKNLASYKARDKRNKINGLKGGRPKKENPVGYESQPKKTLTNNHKPITNNQEPITILTSNKKTLAQKQEVITKIEAEFNEWYEKYPRKVSKQKAKQSYLKLKPNLKTLLKALSWQIKSDEWQDANGKFIPHPSTYLNQQRWEDEKALTSGEKWVQSKSSDNEFIYDTKEKLI